MRYVYLLPAAFLAPVIHEWVKTLVSTAQGDPTPRNHGFLTLNPFKYFEPIGFLLILLFGFGWGRPVPTGALHYRDRQRGVILTYTIPVLVNLLLGIISVVVIDLMVIRLYEPGHIGILFLYNFAVVNINLALFNLLPVYPLAANKLLITFSRPENIARINHYEKVMQVGLIILMVFGFIPNLIGPITNWIINWTWGLLA